MASPAPSCSKALKDATTRWPSRNRKSDGIMGDRAHQTRKSDHNDGNAFDLTHDPTDGPDCNVLSQLVINDSRVTYVIWTGRIFKRRLPDAGWQTYRGPNPHNHHMHVSIRNDARNDLSPWPWSEGAPEGVVIPSNSVGVGEVLAFAGTVLRQQSKGPQVTALQQRLKDLGFDLKVDGDFGPGTFKVVIDFQRQKGLEPDGKVGRNTWAALFEN